MWWFLAGIFGWAFLYGITRPRYTVNNYIEQDINVDCDGGDSYCDSSDYSSDRGSDGS